MLPHKTTEDPTAVEKLFCEPFSRLNVRKMNSPEQEMLKKVIQAENLKAYPFDEMEKEATPMSLQLCIKSMKNRFTFTASSNIQILIGVTGASKGGIIMYLTYLQYWAKKTNKKEITISDYCAIFPNGYPTDEELHKLWISQKVDIENKGSDNLIDYIKASESIHFKNDN